MAARNAALTQRQALAVERIWVEVVELGRFKTLSHVAGALRMDRLMAEGAGDGTQAEAIQKFAATVLETTGFKDPASLRTSNAADKERPFVSPMAWALFSAYRLTITMPATHLMLIKAGLGADILKEPSTQLEPVRSALPDWSKFIDDHQLSALPHLVQPLEDRLLAALSSSLSGADVDEGGVWQAAKVIEAVDKVVAQMNDAKGRVIKPPPSV